MSKTVFALTALAPVCDGAGMSIIVAVRNTKEEIKALHHAFLQRGKITNIKAINLAYYTLVIEIGNATPPMILATGKKQRKDMEWARAHFKALLPYAHIAVMKFGDVGFIKQQEAKLLRGEYDAIN